MVSRRVLINCTLFALHLSNKNEQRTAKAKNKQEQNQPEQIDKAIGELRSEVSAMVKDSEKRILEAINVAQTSSKGKGHNPTLVIGHDEPNLKATRTVETTAATETELTWTEVVKKSRKPRPLAPAFTAQFGKQETAAGPTSTKAPEQKRAWPENNRVPRARPPAVLVEVGREDFPALSKKIRSGVNKEIIGTRVVGMRQTKTGGLLIEIRGGPEKVEAVRAEVARTAGSDVGVKTLQSRDVFEIKNLDEWAMEEEVVDAAATATQTDSTMFRVIGMRKQYGGVQAALVLAPSTATRRIINAGRLIVGMVSCRVRSADNKVRCYRYLSRGHMAKAFVGPDRSDCCFRCGGPGHKAATCDASVEMARTLASHLETREQNLGSEGRANPQVLSQC